MNNSRNAGYLDEEFNQRSVFPGIDANILQYRGRAHSGLPLNAREYILGVMSEARSGPNFVTCKPASMANRKRALRSYEDDDILDRRPPVRPKVTPSIVVEPKPEPLERVQIDQIWSRKFLDNLAETNKLLSAFSPAEYCETSEVKFPMTFRAWRSFLLENQPSLTILHELDSNSMFVLLQYYRKWISPNMTDQLSYWLFTLLAKLPDVLCSDDMSNLRELARKAHKTLLKGDCSSHLRAVLSGILVLVTEVYKQNDLCELFIYENKSEECT